MKAKGLTYLVIAGAFSYLLGCGGSGPIAPDDLVINDVDLVNYIDSVRVDWSSNIPTTGYIDYGLGISLLDSSEYDTAQFVTDHSIGLSNLVHDTVYYYRIFASSEDGQQYFTGIDSFYTGITDTLQFVSIEHYPLLTEAAIEWITTLSAKGYIAYGLDEASLTDTLRDTTDYISIHLDTLQPLAIDTTYYYKIVAWSEDPFQQIESPLQGFATGISGDTTLNIYDFALSGVTPTTATIRFYTDRHADSKILYGISPGVFSDSLTDDNFNIEHQYSLVELIPDTQYYLRIIAQDILHTLSDTLDSTFTTSALTKIILPDTAVNIGGTVQYPVSIQNAEDITALEYTIAYDPALLRVLSVTAGAFTSENDYLFFEPEIDLISGTVYTVITWTITYFGDIPVDTQADGSGIVSYINFEGLAQGNSIISIAADSLKIFDLFGQEFDSEADSGSITVNP